MSSADAAPGARRRRRSRARVDWPLAGGLAGVAALMIAAAAGDWAAETGAPWPEAIDPLDPSALSARARALGAAGRGDAEAATMRFIATRTWRDSYDQAWMLRDAFARGEPDEAVRHADALLRREQDDGAIDRLLALLTAAAALDGPRRALIPALAPAPSWRGAFLRRLGKDGDPGAALAVFEALRGGPTPPPPEEFAGFIQRLVATGDYAGAAAAWARLSPAAATAGDPRVGGPLATSPDGTPFTWSLASGPGASGALEPPDAGGAGPVLRIEYDGFAPADLPGRLLRLTPGATYRLSWRQRTAGGSASQHLHWQLTCAENGATIAAAAPPPPSEAWREATLVAPVPAIGCAAQWLRLVASPGERPDPARIWYQDVRISPLPAAAGPQVSGPPRR